jgi:hypothetical protein
MFTVPCAILKGNQAFSIKARLEDYFKHIQQLFTSL